MNASFGQFAPSTEAPGHLLSPVQLEAALRDIGARRYHNLHPFHRLLHGRSLRRAQVRAWALNRYFYQSMIPVRDASDPPSPQSRRA